jgi:hypothetical protein
MLHIITPRLPHQPRPHLPFNRWMALGLALLLTLVGLLVYRFIAPPQPASLTPVAAPAVAVDPAQQGVMGYIDAHRIAPAVAVDPAQQGVMGYIDAHRIAPAVAVDPAQQGVMGYIDAHRIAPIAIDPAQQAVMEYLRAHER